MRKTESETALQIRKCTHADIEAAGAFYDKAVLWLDAHVNYPRWMYRVYPSESSVREMTAVGSQYIALQNGRIVGAFVLNTDPQGNYHKGCWKKDLPEGSYMVIHALAADPELQGQGIASRIIRFCIEKARSSGHLALRVDTVHDNYPAKRLYEKNGFSYAGDADLERDVEGLPACSLYEFNW
jgi:ribosomal protein S18 acetylase RimI-like enzyme